MWIKNYTASSVREALAGIKKEMGARAVILDTRVEGGLTDRSSGPGARVTVTAASERPQGEVPDTAASERPQGEVPVTIPATETEGPRTLHLRGKLAEVSQMESEVDGRMPAGEARVDADLLARLTNIEEAIREIAASVGRRTSALPLDNWFGAPEMREWLDNEGHLRADLADAYAGHLLDSMPQPDPFLARDRLPAVVCFVGPPGCGKSTLLMKALALWWRTQKTSPPVVEVTGDHAPPSGRSANWAEMFGLQRQHFRFDDTRRLSGYLSSVDAETVFAKCDLPADDEGGERVAKKVIRALGAKIVVLVLSSAIRRATNEHYLGQYAVYSPTHLSFSHWDDAQAYMDARDISVFSRLPLAYCTSGNAPCGQIDPFTNAELRAGIASEICGNGNLMRG